MVALPVIGAGAVIALRAAGLHRDKKPNGSFRAIAAIAAGIALAIATAAVIAAEAGASLFQSDDWVRLGLGMDLSASLDGIARRVAVIVVALSAAMAACRKSSPRAKMGATHYALVLGLEAALLGAIISQDLLAILMFAESASIAALLLFSRGSGPRRRASATWMRALGVPAGAVMLAATVTLGCLHYARQGFLSFALSDLLSIRQTDWEAERLLLIIRAALAVRMIAMLIPCTLKSGLSASRPRAAGFVTIGAIALTVVAMVSLSPQFEHSQDAVGDITAVATPATARYQTGLARQIGAWVMLVTLGFCGAAVIRCKRTRDLLAAVGVCILAMLAVTQCLWRWTGHPQRGDYFASPHAGAWFLTTAWCIALAGMFLSLIYVRRTGRAIGRIADLAGLYHTHPGPAAALTLCLLSLASAPFLGGFFGRVTLLGAAIASGRPVEASAMLMVTMLLTAGCMRVLVTIFSDPPEGDGGPAEPLEGASGQLWRVAITVLATATVILGILPQLLMGPLSLLMK